MNILEFIERCDGNIMVSGVGKRFNKHTLMESFYLDAPLTCHWKWGCVSIGKRSIQ